MEKWTMVGIAVLGFFIIFRGWFQKQWRLMRSDWKSWLKQFWKEWGEPLLVAAVIAIFIRTFLVGPYKIPTGSMRPTLLEGDRIFVDKVSYRFHAPERGDIVVFKYPADPKKDFVKRLVAFGGEEVEIRDGSVYVNGTQLTDSRIAKNFYYNRNDWTFAKEGQVIKVPENSFFVLGDNSAQSSDSRNWGFVPQKSMIGRALVIFWPLYRIGILALI